MAAPRGAWTSCTSYQVIAAPWSRCKRRNGGAFSGNGASVARESESPRPVATMVQTDDEDELHPGGEPSAVPSGSEADPFSDGDALDGEEEDGEDLHEEGRAVPMGCVRVCDSSSLRPWLLPCAPPLLRPCGVLALARACQSAVLVSLHAHTPHADARVSPTPWPRHDTQGLCAHAPPGPVCAQRAGQRV